VVQTIYSETAERLEAVAIDEESGRIATCTRTEIRIYKPCASVPTKSPKVRPLSLDLGLSRMALALRKNQLYHRRPGQTNIEANMSSLVAP
jgi:hypothetical protein